jgi:hypothetical protein
MSDLVNRTLAGGVAGLAATGPMTMFMESAHALLPPHEQYPLPPRHITERAAESVDAHDDMNEPQKEAATAVAHFGYGAAAGAVYGAVSPLLPFGPICNGVTYALGVWAGSYLGVMPALGLHAPATKNRPGVTPSWSGRTLSGGPPSGCSPTALRARTTTNTGPRKSRR